MLIEQLKNEPLVNQCFCDECKENDVSIDIDASIDKKNLLIIKVDKFYNDYIDPQPKSPDCLIIQHCGENNYSMYLIELRDIKGPGGFDTKEIEQKFITCLDDFMSQRYGNHFHDPQYNYNNIRLVFISDPYGFKQNPAKQDKMRGHKFDLLNAIRIPKYFDKHLYIEPKIPNPIIKNCS